SSAWMIDHLPTPDPHQFDDGRQRMGQRGTLARKAGLGNICSRSVRNMADSPLGWSTPPATICASIAHTFPNGKKAASVNAAPARLQRFYEWARETDRIRVESTAKLRPLASQPLM